MAGHSLRRFVFTFKDRAVRDFPTDRRKWDAQRDLVVEVLAADDNEARTLAFAHARLYLTDPFSYE